MPASGQQRHSVRSAFRALVSIRASISNPGRHGATELFRPSHFGNQPDRRAVTVGKRPRQTMIDTPRPWWGLRHWRVTNKEPLNASWRDNWMSDKSTNDLRVFALILWSGCDRNRTLHPQLGAHSLYVARWVFETKDLYRHSTGEKIAAY